MNESSASHVARRSSPSLALACLLLGTTAVLAGVAAGWVGFHRHGLAGLAAVVAADVTCTLAAAAALVLAGSLRNTPHAVSGILGGTLVRMLAPLAVALGCRLTAPELVRAGLFGWLLLFFLLTLTVETLLLVWVLGFGGSVSGANRASKAV